MSGHTNGPWLFRKYYGGENAVAEAEAIGRKPVLALGNNGEAFVTGPEARICTVDAQTKFKRGTGHVGECPERDANARLISAAPDLLEAAYLVRSYLADAAKEEKSRACRAVIEVDIAKINAAIAKATGDA